MSEDNTIEAFNDIMRTTELVNALANLTQNAIDRADIKGCVEVSTELLTTLKETIQTQNRLMVEQLELMAQFSDSIKKPL